MVVQDKDGGGVSGDLRRTFIVKDGMKRMRVYFYIVY